MPYWIVHFVLDDGSRVGRTVLRLAQDPEFIEWAGPSVFYSLWVQYPGACSGLVGLNGFVAEILV